MMFPEGAARAKSAWQSFKKAQIKGMDDVKSHIKQMGFQRYENDVHKMVEICMQDVDVMDTT